MWNRKPHIDDEKLDRLSDELLRAFEASEVEINNAATSPFLYRRIRVRIEAEERRRAEDSTSWVALLTIERQAIPALALIAVLATSWHWVGPERIADNNIDAGTVIQTLSSGMGNDDLDASLIGWQNNDLPRSEEKK